MYKTGDLCRVMPDGNIEFLGRIDFQVKIRGFRIELGEIETVLGKLPAARQVVVTARKEANGQHRLAAYLAVGKEALKDQDAVVTQARAFLKKELPDYMVPALFVLLEAMPLSPNGKIDRKALPEPVVSQSTSEYIPPETETERILAGIWADLLGIPQVGRHDNFFELGGDSILSIQFISRAQTKGLYLTPRDVFEAQTIEALAQVARQNKPVQTDQGLVKGDVLLTPIQHWFFEKHRLNPHHFNQSVLLELDRTIDVELLSSSFGHLIHHHDALRSRFEQTSQGWRQWVTEDQSIEEMFRQIDLSAFDASLRDEKLREVNRELQSTLNIVTGPLIRAALIEYGGSQPQKLLIVIHHLAVDFVSWQILIHDLWMAYDQLKMGSKVRLPDKTSSFKAWSEWLSEHAYETKVEEELEYWLRNSEQTIHPLPLDRPQNRNKNRTSDMEKVVVNLSAPETKVLLRDVQHVYHTQVIEVLLTALVQTFSEWTGSPNLLVDLEGHGRESESLDVSRTVGWFTTLFPVHLRLVGSEYGHNVQAIKKQMRSIPQKGMRYGLLRYLNQHTAPRLASLPEAEVIFNYGGQLRTVNIKAMDDELADEDSPGYLFNISGSVVNDQLIFSWMYSREIYERGTVEYLGTAFIRNLRNLIEYCISNQVQTDGYRAEDFPLAALAQHELENIIGQGADIVDIYPLSPMQSIILEESLAAQGSGVYFTQLGIEITQRLDTERFKQAWQRVLERYEMFRTRFVWQNLKQPMQVVHDTARMIWDEQDWRGIPASEKFRWLDGLMGRERRSGFDLSQEPPIRFTLVRLEDDLYHFIWHCHHLLMDGWTSATVLREVAELYLDPFAYLPEPHRYRDYIAWIQNQDLIQAEAYWRENLSGFFSPSLLPHQKQGHGNHPEFREETLVLSESLLHDLQSFAHSQRITINVLFQACWALTLNHFTREQDVIFGVTVSGRSAPLAGIESRVGLFINTLPLRVHIRPEQSIQEWLWTIMRDQINLEQYIHTTPDLLENCSKVLGGRPLFNSSLRFQNYPMKNIAESLGGGLNVQRVTGVDWWHYPMNVVVVPDSGVKLTINYDARYFDAYAVRQTLRTMEEILSRFVHGSNRGQVKSLLAF